MVTQTFNQEISPERVVSPLFSRAFLLAEGQGYQQACPSTQPNGKGFIKTEMEAGTQTRNPQGMI
jgi:hypothetical protein